jgi:ribosomal protein S18 acetylase RimI-like enzyme
MYTPGMEKEWEGIWKKAKGVLDLGTTFESEFPQFRQCLQHRMFFIYFKGFAVATASAWFSFRPEYLKGGQVHSVAVVQGHSNIGLGKHITSLCTNALIDFGHEDIYVETTKRNRRAIQLYKNLGFKRRQD